MSFGYNSSVVSLAKLQNARRVYHNLTLMMGICQVFPIYPVSVEYLTVNGVIKKKLNITYTRKRLETVEKHIGQMPDFHWRDLGSSPGGIKFHGTIFLVLR